MGPVSDRCPLTRCRTSVCSSSLGDIDREPDRCLAGRSLCRWGIDIGSWSRVKAAEPPVFHRISRTQRLAFDAGHAPHSIGSPTRACVDSRKAFHQRLGPPQLVAIPGVSAFDCSPCPPPHASEVPIPAATTSSFDSSSSFDHDRPSSLSASFRQTCRSRTPSAT